MTRVALLAGGVGGARLLQGLDRLTDVETVAIVNTGDDLTHWGLRICPDLDTCMYTLAGLADAERGWGLRDESWRALEGMRRYGAEDWFALGDRDLATHLRRSEWLGEGVPLSEVTRRLCEALGVRSRLLPMSDLPCPTVVNGVAFQTWLVRHRAPPVETLALTHNRAAPGVQQALAAADLVVVAPSNPYVSIDPILGCTGLPKGTPVVGLSPIVGGRAVKGPLAEMIRALARREPSPQAVWDHYGFLDGMLIESGDELAGPHRATRTVMGGPEDRERLARELVDFGLSL